LRNALNGWQVSLLAHCQPEIARLSKKFKY
jgi:hypothetical protein